MLLGEPVGDDIVFSSGLVGGLHGGRGWVQIVLL